MSISSNTTTHFREGQISNIDFNNNLADIGITSSNHQVNEHKAFENIFSTNLEDLVKLTDDHTKCEETEYLISEAMTLPPEQREIRLKEIEQHERFLQRQEKRKKILNDKNHRPFDDSNIGLCSVCMDDNFQIVHQFGADTACDECFRKIREI